MLGCLIDVRPRPTSDDGIDDSYFSKKYKFQTKNTKIAWQYGKSIAEVHDQDKTLHMNKRKIIILYVKKTNLTVV